MWLLEAASLHSAELRADSAVLLLTGYAVH